LLNANALTPEEWESIKHYTQRICLEKEEILFAEGSAETELYFLEEGSLSVIKNSRAIATLSPKNWVGEISALLKGRQRSATVRAKERCTLIQISLSDLKKSSSSRPDILLKILTNLSETLAFRLESSTKAHSILMQKELSSAKIKIVMAHFIIWFICAFAAFFYALKLVSTLNLQPKVSSVMTIPLLLLLSFFLVQFINRSGYPLSFFGLTCKGTKRAIIESLLCTIPIALFLLGFKWTLYHLFSQYKGLPLFHFPQLLQMHLSLTEWGAMTLGYILLVPIQSLMVNGVLQGALTHFFTGPKKAWAAIFLSNLVFSTLHLQFSLLIAAIVFLLGCTWGWLYMRHQTIVGISLSHILIGFWGLLFLGAP
jgi:membrane protease YdiL (CAAX protease family)